MWSSQKSNELWWLSKPKCTIVAMMSPFWKRELTWTPFSMRKVHYSLSRRSSLGFDLSCSFLWFCFEWNDDDKRKNFGISWLKTYFMKIKLLFSTNLQQNLRLLGFQRKYFSINTEISISWADNRNLLIAWNQITAT